MRFVSCAVACNASIHFTYNCIAARDCHCLSRDSFTVCVSHMDDGGVLVNCTAKSPLFVTVVEVKSETDS
jgi:hypothetical protein